LANPLRFISNLFGSPRKTTPAHKRNASRPIEWKELTEAFNSYGGGATLQALKVSTAFACIDRIAKDIASLPLRPLRSNDGGKEIAKDHDQYFLSKYPSPRFTKYTWVYTLVFHQYQYGECFAPIRRKNGRPVEYGIWLPCDVEHKIIDGRLYWINTKTKETKSDEDMIHIMDYTEDGIRGKSRLSLAKQTVDLASYGAKMAATLYKNQMWQPGYLAFKNDFTSEQAEMISKTWGSKGGEQDNYDIPVIDNGGEFKHFGMSLQSSEYNATMKNAALEICRFFGMPPSKVGIMEGNVSYNSLEQENIGYVQDSLLPVCIGWEQELDRKSLADADMDVIGFKYELKGRLRGDMAARAAFYQMGLTTGLLSINDTLRLEDMDTIGPEGDERYINAASVPLSKLYSGELDDQNQDDQIKQLVKGIKLNGNGTHKVQ
jgi:HK97 family phage portal protein